VRFEGLALAMIFSAAPLGACTWIAAKNPVKAAAACGLAQDPTGAPIADFDLRLVRENQELVAEVHTDGSGHFQFPPVAKGSYYMTTASGGWLLGSALVVTGSKQFASCRHPLIVQPSIGCGGGSINKKGYHPKY
jgi:hypothetical protein